MGPAYLSLIALVVSFFGTIIGGFSRIFGWRHSRTVLAVAAGASLVSFAAYETYASTNLVAAIGAVWIFLMGWLIATPVPNVPTEQRRRAVGYTYASAASALGSFVVAGWLLLSPGQYTSYSADLSVEIESGSATDTAEFKTTLIVGRVSTVRLDSYVVDFLVADSLEHEIEMRIRLFENVDGERGAMLAPCIDVRVPVNGVFGAGASCGDLSFGFGGQIDRVE